MSEKTEVDQEYDKEEDASQFPRNLPEHQYSRAELISISETVSGRRHKCLDPAYNSEDGKWDPDRWYKAQFELSGEVSPLTLGDGKDRRRVAELDWDLKRKPSLSDPVERLKEERDGIVLSPQRRSFGTGCHVQSTLLYTRQLNLPDRDRDEPRVEKERDRDRDRERPVRKIGSGRIQIDRENSRDYSGLRDRFDERDQDRDREFAWNRERDRDRERDWERDVRERDVRDTEWDKDRDRDRRFDRFRRVGDFSDRDRRDRDFRDRGFDRNSRRRNNYRDEEKEPEWFTGGPSSQTDTIELRGFDKVGGDTDETGDRKSDKKNENKKRATPSNDKSSKESSEETSEADIKVSQRSSPEEDQQTLHIDHQEQLNVPICNHQEDNKLAVTPQQNSRASPSNNKLFDFDEILKASILPLQDEEPTGQGSRFSRFFSGMSGNKRGSDTFSIEDMLVPHDLLEDNHTSPVQPSMVGPMGAVPTHLGQVRLGLHEYQDQLQGHNKEPMFLSQNLMPVPNSAGDNNAGFEKSAVPPSVTALFNSAVHGGSNASMSSNSSFSTQDAEAQLKAMLFGGHKDSAPSSGTASPASLPPSVQRKVKTVAELEADMHQNSPQKTSSYMSVSSSISNPTSSGDMTAFNRLLIMINAASEASQNATQTDRETSHTGFGVVPSHNEFNHAVMRNKEEQIQLQQQSLQNAQSVHLQPGMLAKLPPPSFNLHHQIPPPNQQMPPPNQQMPPPNQQMPPPNQQMPPPNQQMPPPNQQQPPLLVNQLYQSPATFQQLQKPQQFQQQSAVNNTKQISGLMKPPGTPGLQTMSSSHPNVVIKPRAQSGGPLMSSDPIYSLIQQNPTIVMNPASPGPNIAALLASQQSAVSNTARVPSPLMFSQQPPLHLSAPSPIHPGQLSPRSLTVGTNLSTSTMASPTGMRSPVLPRVLSPQEISAHAQAVMQSALIKKQLQDQSERYYKKQQERAKSPNQLPLSSVKQPPAIHPVTPSAAQTKSMPVNTFTPTSVLRKMHMDKKEKQALEGRGEDEMELITNVYELGGRQHDQMDSHSLDGMSRKSEKKLLGDLSDISFLDPINLNLMTTSSQSENQLRMGQTNILPGPLSQPMSVEEKMKLLALAEKPGYLSQMLDKSAKAAAAAEAARTGQGRPIVKAQEQPQEDRSLQQHFYVMQQHQPPPPMMQGGRLVTGGSPKMQPSFVGMPNMQSNLTQLSSLQQNAVNKPPGGRAIVGGNSSQQQSQIPVVSNQNMDVLRMLDLQRMQQIPQSQGMVLPPPPMGTPISCLGPPPVAVPVQTRICAPVHPAANVTMMHQQIVRANAINAQHNQQVSHFMVLQQAQQHRSMTPLSSLHMVMPGVSAPLSPRNQATGPLSPAALSATIQRVASPHGALKMNGPLPPVSAVNGGNGPKIDLNSGIQRWFSPDILKTQLPSMPPLPAKGNQVMTVDELEGN